MPGPKRSGLRKFDSIYGLLLTYCSNCALPANSPFLTVQLIFPINIPERRSLMKFDAALAQPGISGTSFSIPLSKGPANTKYVYFLL